MCSCGRFHHSYNAVLRCRILAWIIFLFYLLWPEEFQRCICHLSPARVRGIYPVIFQSLNWWLPIQVDQLENRMLNAERNLLMWNSKGQRLLVVDVVKLDITGRHVQIILLKNDFMIFTFCYTTCFVLWNEFGIINIWVVVIF